MNLTNTQMDSISDKKSTQSKAEDDDGEENISSKRQKLRIDDSENGCSTLNKNSSNIDSDFTGSKIEDRIDEYVQPNQTNEANKKGNEDVVKETPVTIEQDEQDEKSRECNEDNGVEEVEKTISSDSIGDDNPKTNSSPPRVSATRSIRLEQNRKAARESRKRKKIMIEELQRSVIYFSRANSVLRQKNEELGRILVHAQSFVQHQQLQKQQQQIQRNQDATLRGGETSNDVSNENEKVNSNGSPDIPIPSQPNRSGNIIPQPMLPFLGQPLAPPNSTNATDDKLDDGKNSEIPAAQTRAQLTPAQVAAAQALFGQHAVFPQEAAARTATPGQTFAPTHAHAQMLAAVGMRMKLPAGVGIGNVHFQNLNVEAPTTMNSNRGTVDGLNLNDGIQQQQQSQDTQNCNTVGSTQESQPSNATNESNATINFQRATAAAANLQAAAVNLQAAAVAANEASHLNALQAGALMNAAVQNQKEQQHQQPDQQQPNQQTQVQQQQAAFNNALALQQRAVQAQAQAAAAGNVNATAAQALAVSNMNVAASAFGMNPGAVGGTTNGMPMPMPMPMVGYSPNVAAAAARHSQTQIHSHPSLAQHFTASPSMNPSAAQAQAVAFQFQMASMFGGNHSNAGVVGVGMNNIVGDNNTNNSMNGIPTNNVNIADTGGNLNVQVKERPGTITNNMGTGAEAPTAV